MTIQEKNPQRGQRGGGGRLTPVTSLQAAARGETGPSPQHSGPGALRASAEPASPCAPMSCAADQGWHGGPWRSAAPQHGRSWPSCGRDELCKVSAQLPADKLLSRQLPPNTPFGSYFGRGVSGADSGRILPLPPRRRSRAGGG